MIHTVKGFSIVNEAEVDIFLEFPCFLHDAVKIGNLISGFSTSSKPSFYIWKFLFHILLKPALKDFEHILASIWDERNCAEVWTFFDIVLLWDWNENWPFPVLWPLLGFPNILTYWVLWFRSYLDGLVVFPTFFNLTLNFNHDLSHSQPGLIFVILQSFSIFGCKEHNQFDFGMDHLYPHRVIYCVFGRWCLLLLVCSPDKTVSLCPASFCTLRPNLLVILGISRLPIFAFQSPIMKRTSLFGVSSRRPCRSS